MREMWVDSLVSLAITVDGWQGTRFGWFSTLTGSLFL